MARLPRQATTALPAVDGHGTQFGRQPTLSTTLQLVARHAVRGTDRISDYHAPTPPLELMDLVANLNVTRSSAYSGMVDTVAWLAQVWTRCPTAINGTAASYGEVFGGSHPSRSLPP